MVRSTTIVYGIYFFIVCRIDYIVMKRKMWTIFSGTKLSFDIMHTLLHFVYHIPVLYQCYNIHTNTNIQFIIHLTEYSAEIFDS